MNARHYDPEAGRFISQDTYRGEDTDAGTWHLYAYCNGNPINYTDPSGHKQKSKIAFYDKENYNGDTVLRYTATVKFIVKNKKITKVKSISCDLIFHPWWEFNFKNPDSKKYHITPKGKYIHLRVVWTYTAVGGFHGNGSAQFLHCLNAKIHYGKKTTKYANFDSTPANLKSTDWKY